MGHECRSGLFRCPTRGPFCACVCMGIRVSFSRGAVSLACREARELSLWGLSAWLLGIKCRRFRIPRYPRFGYDTIQHVLTKCPIKHTFLIRKGNSQTGFQGIMATGPLTYSFYLNFQGTYCSYCSAFPVPYTFKASFTL